MYGYGRFAALADHLGDDADGRDSDADFDSNAHDILEYDSEFSYGDIEYEATLSSHALEIPETPIDLDQPGPSRVSHSGSEPGELDENDFVSG